MLHICSVTIIETCVNMDFEESLSDLFVSIGLDLDLDLEESSSVMTGGGSDDQRESTDSASFSIPSLELSDGVIAAGNSVDMEDDLSLSHSAQGVEGCSPSTDIPSLKEDEALEADGGVTSDALISNC